MAGGAGQHVVAHVALEDAVADEQRVAGAVDQIAPAAAIQRVVARATQQPVVAGGDSMLVTPVAAVMSAFQNRHGSRGQALVVMARPRRPDDRWTEIAPLLPPPRPRSKDGRRVGPPASRALGVVQSDRR